MEGKIKAILIGNRIIVLTSEEGSILYREGYFGKPVGIRKPKSFNFGNNPLELSLVEALFLIKQDRIEIFDENGKKLEIDELENKAIKEHVRFTEKFLIYTHLRELGFVVRPGLKFGADFAVYEHGPGIDHSPFLVQVLPRGSQLSPIELVRAGRLATTVRKRFIIATIPEAGEPRYYMFNWFKP